MRSTTQSSKADGSLVDTALERRLVQWLIQAEPGARVVALERLREGYLATAFARSVLNAILAVQQPGVRVDVVEVARWLMDGEDGNRRAGVTTVADLVDDGDAAFDPLSALAHLRELWARRRIVAACRAVASSQASSAVMAAQLRLVLDEVDAQPESHFRPLADVMPEAAQRIEDAGRWLLPVGLRSFDRKAGGLMRGNLVVLGARTSVGKTALALRLARGTAAQGVSAAVVSTEMSAARLMLRLVADAASVENWDLQRGRVGEEELQRVGSAFARLVQLPLYLCDRVPTWPQLIAELVALKARDGALGLVVIDYVQMLRGVPGPREQTRQQQLGRITRDLKRLARSLDVAVLAVAQLNRRSDEGTKGVRRPALSDFRESGDFEQDADAALLLWRPDYGRHDAPLAERRTIELIIAKNRDGPVGKLELHWDSRFVRIEDLEEAAFGQLPEAG